ncbi:MAG: hypothetical protein K0Q94_4325 [Paenibacillus sp.]|jgi:hypothetical protein|nr:hypothetical protein [Paenibacillus sp.]
MPRDELRTTRILSNSENRNSGIDFRYGGHFPVFPQIKELLSAIRPIFLPNIPIRAR